MKHPEQANPSNQKTGSGRGVRGGVWLLGGCQAFSGGGAHILDLDCGFGRATLKIFKCH